MGGNQPNSSTSDLGPTDPNTEPEWERTDSLEFVWLVRYEVMEVDILPLSLSWTEYPKIISN